MSTDPTRRNVLLSTLFGAGAIGLRALATGLPLGFLARSRSAEAAPAPDAPADDPQHLVLVTSASGDPMNANVPGTYIPNVYHSPSAAMAATNLVLGARTYTAAQAWTTLDATLKGRVSFMHHGTYTNAHGDALKVQTAMGAVTRQEVLVSMIARELAPRLGTIQAEPVVISQNLVTAKGATLPVLAPTVLKKVLAAPAGALLNLQRRRDQDLDKLNALIKQTGRKADAAILDRYALSQTQVRSLEQTLLEDLGNINGSTRADLNLAAAVLIRMKVSPVVVMSYGWGGDNHRDTDLAGEAAETSASVLGLNDLYAQLTRYGMGDHVTIAAQNVFGRTLHVASHSNEPNGRNHNASHHCTVLIGKRVNPSVIGGITLNSAGTDFRAQGFDAATGAANDGGDVPYEDTLASVGRTIGAAVGVPAATLDTEVTRGKTISAAVTV